MGVESKIRELMETAAKRPADKSQGDATNPTQGDSNPNPEMQDLSGADKNGGLTSTVGTAASGKQTKDTTLPAGQGAKDPKANMENSDDTESVVMQPNSKGNVHQEEVEQVDEAHPGDYDHPSFKAKPNLSPNDPQFKAKRLEIVKKGAQKVDAKNDAAAAAARKDAERAMNKEEVEADYEDYEDYEEVVESALYEEDLAKLFEADENLTEEFKTQAAEIFEAVVTSRVSSEIAEIEEEIVEQANVAVQAEVERMVENIDKYLAYVTEQWMSENKIALESSLRTEITESFIKDLQRVFTENYIEVPEEKYQVMEELDQKAKGLQEELDAKIEENIALTEEAIALKKEIILSVVSEDLADTEAEKFSTLVEDVAYTSADAYESKLNIIKENYFPKDKASADAILEDTGDNVVHNENTNNRMARYSAAITNSAKF